MKIDCGRESLRLLLSLRGSLTTLLSPFAGTLSIEKLHVPIMAPEGLCLGCGLRVDERCH